MRTPCVLIALYLSALLFAVDAEQAAAARQALFSAQHLRAAELYSALVKVDPTWDFGHYALVRALLDGERAHDAYVAAETAAKAAPNTAGTETALGMVAMRRGEVSEAERHFKLALKIDPKYSPALRGLARVFSTISKFETARGLLKSACSKEDEDPECIRALSEDEEGAPHIAGIERLLATYDPNTREARNLRVDLDFHKALGSRKARRLISPYQHYNLPLEKFVHGPNQEVYGLGIRLTVNGKAFSVLLDTGASGLAISPRAAKKAGLEGLSDEAGEVRGIGDGKVQARRIMLAKEVRTGELAFADVPISAGNGVAGDDDGLVGADFFQKFLVSIDFNKAKLVLDPFPEMPNGPLKDAPNQLAPGFARVFRSGNHFLLPTAINRSGSFLFLVDSGGSSNLVDVETARKFTPTYRDSSVGLQGIQGEVEKVSRASRLELTFASFRQANQDVLAANLSKVGDGLEIGVAGVLGMPVLRRMTLTLDYVNGAINLQFH